MDRTKCIGSHEVLSGSSHTTTSSHYRGTKVESQLRGSGGYVARPIISGRLSCGSPRLVALGIFRALTKLKSAANDLPYTSQVALGLFGQCNAQASKVAHLILVIFILSSSFFVCLFLFCFFFS